MAVGGAAGLVAPAVVTLMIVSEPDPALFASIGAPVLAIGLMGSGMIAASLEGRLWTGVLAAVASGVGLVLLSCILGMPMLQNPMNVGIAALVASFSFAARGALFARSSGRKGRWIALFIVAGEAAILATAAADPGLWPDWVLVLLPAQWASMAIRSAVAGAISGAALAALIALGGTAAATLLVRHLWPSRWPYLVMFSTWLALSALVYHQL